MNNAVAAKLEGLAKLRDQLVAEVRSASSGQERREAREALCDCLSNIRILVHS